MGYIGLEYRVLGEARGRVFWPGEQCERLGQSLDDWTRVGTSAREGYKSDLVSPSRCHTYQVSPAFSICRPFSFYHRQYLQNDS